MRRSTLLALPIAVAFGLLYNVKLEVPSDPAAGGPLFGMTVEMSTAAAQTVRGTARRTTRRTTRRYTYYYTLPTGCVTRVVAGVRYRYCGGVYYQSVTDDSGNTAYIIVNP